MRETNDIITVLGVIGNDPEEKVTSSGVPLIKFRMASTQRKYDKNTNTWSDGNTNWYTVSAFRGLAKNAMASLHRGDPVVVTGRLHLRAWDTGERRGTSIDLEADVIGLDLQWGTASFRRTTRALPLDQAQPSTGNSDGPTAGEPTEPPAEHWSVPGAERVSELEATPF
ncbi:single-stranded DNA-binding protein [Microterricola pindariensis]|uniref:Single-stranded DNA-binding protein n=1 Tax=Microterricola pindariensis TaxID=478010 RepID=A0ABX5AVI8_9MICO|nr:single-stranded DNA-binding protein [Microterricola pindariensis]PPL18349.1 hypothetical protein GY24_10550 [Microterricola pindariensis]